MRPTDNGSAGTVNLSVKSSSPFRVGNQTQDYPLGWGSVRDNPIGTLSSHYVYDNKSVIEFYRIWEKSVCH